MAYRRRRADTRARRLGKIAVTGSLLVLITLSFFLLILFGASHL